MGHNTEAFVGIDTSKLRNAIAIADGGRGGEVRYLGEFPATEAAIRKLVAKLAAKRYMARAFASGGSMRRRAASFVAERIACSIGAVRRLRTIWMLSSQDAP